MMEIDMQVANEVKEIFLRCRTEEKELWDHRYIPKIGRQYPKFEEYRGYYSPLEKLGIEVVDPKSVGFLLGNHEGNCRRFLGSLLGGTYVTQDVNSPDTLPEPEDNCVVIYNASNPQDSRSSLDETHFGLVKDGKVLSKWNFGPVFRHDFSQMPYVGFSREIKGVMMPDDHWIIFKRPSHHN
jgi:hypothetical protein